MSDHDDFLRQARLAQLLGQDPKASASDTSNTVLVPDDALVSDDTKQAILAATQLMATAGRWMGRTAQAAASRATAKAQALLKPRNKVGDETADVDVEDSPFWDAPTTDDTFPGTDAGLPPEFVPDATPRRAIGLWVAGAIIVVATVLFVFHVGTQPDPTPARATAEQIPSPAATVEPVPVSVPVLAAPASVQLPPQVSKAVRQPTPPETVRPTPVSAPVPTPTSQATPAPTQRQALPPRADPSTTPPTDDAWQDKAEDDMDAWARDMDLE